MPIGTNSFPLSPVAIEAFENFKKDLANSLIVAINIVPLVVEKDASNYVIAATLRQFGHLVVFLFKDSAVKKETNTIVKALRKLKLFNWMALLIKKKNQSQHQNNEQKLKAIRQWDGGLNSVFPSM